MTSSTTPQIPRSTSAMYVAGVVILVLVALWFAFQAADGLGLPTRQSSALVVGKTHRDAAQTYTTTIINKQPHVVPHVTDEAYVLDLDLRGIRTTGVTDRELYERVREGEQVRVTYRERRLSGGVEVVAIAR